MSIVLDSETKAIVISEPETIIGGKDSLKISVTVKPSTAIYDYTSGSERFIVARKYYDLLNFHANGFDFFFRYYSGNNGNQPKLYLRMVSDTGILNNEATSVIDDVFPDGLEHSFGIQYFLTGEITYFVDDISVGTDKWNTSTNGKSGFKGLMLPKFGSLVLGNVATLDSSYPFLGEYFDIRVAEEGIDDEGDPIFEDYSRSYLTGEITLTLANNIDDIVQYTSNLNNNDMIMHTKGFRKGRYNRKLMYRNDNISTPDLEAEAESMEGNVSELTILQNRTSSVVIRI